MYIHIYRYIHIYIYIYMYNEENIEETGGGGEEAGEPFDPTGWFFNVEDDPSKLIGKRVLR
jgi:hypothetical protein